MQQAETSLAELLDRTAQPVSFVVSTGLGSPPGVSRLQTIRDRFPGLGFKVDLSEEWTADTVRTLAEFGGIDTVDFKAHYGTSSDGGTFTGPPPNVDQYCWIAEGLPDAWLEDPAWSGPAWEVLQPHRDRVTWDAVLHSLADLAQLPSGPNCVNIKPSRFGFVSELMRTYEYCLNRGLRMYGGGQFELGPGRGQLQRLANLFHPDGSNDVAPRGFNEADLDPGLPGSQLRLPPAALGFRWDKFATRAGIPWSHSPSTG